MPSRGIRTGIDLVDIPRFGIAAGRRGGAFLERIFTPGELASSPALQSLAGGFAAKEAFLKALGTGLSDGISWHDVEIVHREGGRPDLVLARRAAELLGSGQASLSISHTSTTAVAVVVISGGDAP
ncbi:MAG TPA: holo-ACP synthase [Candidatus Fermentibacter sp.]|nr:holo-ACP synthase [Candidatus Fermentibacter sp.]